MKIRTKHKNSGIEKSEHNLFNTFIEFLQKKYPLKKDIQIDFLGERVKEMTTGSRTDKNKLLILSAGRLNRDVLRTLAHEWIHQHQRTVLKRKKGPNIGGKNEDEANAISGQLVKKFEKYYPKFSKLIYKTNEKHS